MTVKKMELSITQLVSDDISLSSPLSVFLILLLSSINGARGCTMTLGYDISDVSHPDYSHFVNVRLSLTPALPLQLP